MKNKKGKSILILIFVILLGVSIYIENNALQVSKYELNIDMKDTSIRIIHLSDLHGKEFGKGNARLIRKVSSLLPDIIVITGDWIDKETKDLGSPAQTMKELTEIAPVYYVPGNHEYWNTDLDGWLAELDERGLEMLQNEMVTFTIKGIDINILGLDESHAAPGSNESKGLFSDLEKMEGIKLVLAHYPENFALIGERSYEHHSFDLLLTGHAHGGQIILPFIGGLISPGEGLDPKYYEGMHEGKNSRMIISRGLGNSIIPIRIFNRPEIVVLDLSEFPDQFQIESNCFH